MAANYTVRTVKRALTRTGGFLNNFTHTLNPYIGCAFGVGLGCPFCYVRALPVANTMPAPWGSWVIAKINLAEVLRRELDQLDSRGELGDVSIFMSSSTDPYQGLERKLAITRCALLELLKRKPRRLVVQTRSPLIERDLDLLRAFGQTLMVSLTLETDDENVRRSITPSSPSVSRRLLTAARLKASGIYVQIAIAPMLPNNPSRFADLLKEVADRVVIDTFCGDGANGVRSRNLGIEQLYRKLGYGDPFSPHPVEELTKAMIAKLGADRVLQGQHGFNAI